METAFLFACGLLLVGLLLRAKLPWLQTLYIPAAISGGLLGLLLVQTIRAFDGWGWKKLVQETDVLVDHLSEWPGWLIAVVFATLFLDKPRRSWRQVFGRALRQGNMVWIICLGQVAVGLLAAWFIIGPLHLSPFDGDVPIFFGQLIEAGFVGGHGTSAALGAVYYEMGFAEAKDLAFFMATIGLIYSVISGMFFVNLGVRCGWVRSSSVKLSRVSGMEARHSSNSIGTGKVNSDVLDPLVFQALIVALAFAVGLGLRWLVGLASLDLPLFMFTLLGGWLVRDGMRWIGCGDLIDGDTIRRLSAAAMEFLIVAAIAALNLQLVAKSIVPLSILLVLAFLWTAVCLIVIGRRLLPQSHWFELGLINYGMSTGVTATGLMLLRIVDKDFDSGAAEDYALAAPLSSPFVGGGLVTVIVFPQMLHNLGTPATALITLGATCGLFLFGLALAKQEEQEEQAKPAK